MEKITYASLGSLGEDFHHAFDTALDRRPDCADAWLGRALIAMRRGASAEALEAVTTAQTPKSRWPASAVMASGTLRSRAGSRIDLGCCAPHGALEDIEPGSTQGRRSIPEAELERTVIDGAESAANHVR